MHVRLHYQQLTGTELEEVGAVKIPRLWFPTVHHRLRKPFFLSVFRFASSAR